jgi:hypothetical protein
MTINASGPIGLGGTTGSSINLELGKSSTATTSFSNTDFRRLSGNTATNSPINYGSFYNKSYLRWTNRSDGLSAIPFSQAIVGFIWTGSLWIALGNSIKLATSPDLVTWTNQPGVSNIGVSGYGLGIAYGAGKYVIIGADGNFYGKCITSTDLVTWTNQSSFASIFGLTKTPTKVVYGSSKFVAFGNGSTATSGTCATSPDGVTWTARTYPNTYTNDCVWTGSQFVAVGLNQNGNGVCATSPDGITWTSRTITNVFPNLYAGPKSIAWNGTTLVCTNNGNLCATSTDGITWTLQSGFTTAMNNENASYVTWTGSKFIAAGTTTNRIVISTDGITWKYYSGIEDSTASIPTNSIRSIGSNGSTVLLGGLNGKLVSATVPA